MSGNRKNIVKQHKHALRRCKENRDVSLVNHNFI